MYSSIINKSLHRKDVVLFQWINDYVRSKNTNNATTSNLPRRNLILRHPQLLTTQLEKFKLKSHLCDSFNGFQSRCLFGDQDATESSSSTPGINVNQNDETEFIEFKDLRFVLVFVFHVLSCIVFHFS